MSTNIEGVTVLYLKDGQKTSKTLKFKDNFTMNINGKRYFTDSGHVYDLKTNEEIKTFDFANNNDNATAYQLLGMSCTAESARDYTFSKKDIDEARRDSLDKSICDDGITKSDRRSASVIGNGAGNVIMGATTFEDGIYTTEYRSKANGQISQISIWLTK